MPAHGKLAEGCITLLSGHRRGKMKRKRRQTREEDTYITHISRPQGSGSTVKVKTLTTTKERQHHHITGNALAAA